MVKSAIVVLILISAHFSDGAEQPASKEEGNQKRGFFESILSRARNSGSESANTNTNELSSLSKSQMNDGVKQVLQNGLQAAVSLLGQTNGFLTNLAVRIPVPQELALMERSLRVLKQDALIDQFEVTMNRAAEKAVPAATDVFVDAVKAMSVRDAAELLTAESDTAITEYFKKSTSTNLLEKFLPIVKEATASSGVTGAYNQLLDRVSAGRFSFLSKTAVNLDHYVTGRAMDGLFLMVAEEEKCIRANPAARTTELLREVFGAVSSH